MTRTRTLLVTTAAAAVLLAVGLAAQGTVTQPPRSKISKDSAATIARKEVPNGTVQAGELEKEGGKWIYSFDIKVAGRPGVEEIAVDAITGAVLAHEHESPAAEKAEAAGDTKAKAHKPDSARATVRQP